MNIDIANMAVNLGEKIESIDYFEHFITFASVFAGAYFAYWFGMKLELRKSKRQMRADLCTLCAEVELNLNKLLQYKKMHLNKLRNNYAQNDKTIMSLAHNFPNISISFDINKYIFLLDCNAAFISEIETLKKTEKYLNEAWNEYLSSVSKFSPYSHQDNAKIAMYVPLVYLRKIYNVFVVRLYLLNKHLSQCYTRFFNVYYFDNIKDEYQDLVSCDKEIEALLNDSDIKKWDEDFNKYWRPERTFILDVKFTYRKIKYYLKAIRAYFFAKNKLASDKKDK